MINENQVSYSLIRDDTITINMKTFSFRFTLEETIGDYVVTRMKQLVPESLTNVEKEIGCGIHSTGIACDNESDVV